MACICVAKVMLAWAGMWIAWWSFLAQSRARSAPPCKISRLATVSAAMTATQLMFNAQIWQPGFDLPRQQWSLLNRFRTKQGHCSACRRKWRLTDTDRCPCGETQTMSHSVESCPLTKLIGGLSRLHSADEDAVSWIMADKLWFMTRIREEEECSNKPKHLNG